MDINEQDEAAAIFKKSMQEAIAHIDKIAHELQLAEEKVIEDQLAATEELRRIESEAKTIFSDFIEKNRKQYEDQIRNETLLDITKKLMLAGRSSVEIIQWLSIPKDLLVDAWHEIGFSKLGDHVAHVAYEQQGRTGYLFFYREDIMLRFPFEFGAGDTLAFIEMPSQERWTKETSLPLADRLPTLNFIGERVVRDQTTGNHTYEILDDAIRIITIGEG